MTQGINTLIPVLQGKVEGGSLPQFSSPTPHHFLSRLSRIWQVLDISGPFYRNPSLPLPALCFHHYRRKEFTPVGNLEVGHVT